MATVPKYRARMTYQTEITADSILVEFNGTPYEVGRDAIGGYGNVTLMTSTPTTGNYPFYIIREDDVNYVYVRDTIGSNPFTLKITSEAVTTTKCFDDAVRDVMSGVVSELLVVGMDGGVGTPAVLDRTWQEIYDAFPNVMIEASSAKLAVLGVSEQPYEVITADPGVGGTMTFTADSEDGYPTS